MALCPISFLPLTPGTTINTSKLHAFECCAFLMLIDVANLGIDIRNATQEEWVQTAYTDTRDSGTLRLRNPLTNQMFSETELTGIYDFYHAYWSR